MKSIRKGNYNFFQNFKYIYKGVIKHRFSIIPLGIIQVICSVGTSFIGLFLSKYIIDYITIGKSINDFIVLVVVLGIFQLLFSIGKSISQDYLQPGFYYVRPMFILDKLKKQIKMKYTHLEDRASLDLIEKADAAVMWPEVGVEGFLRITVNSAVNLGICIMSVILLISVNLYLVPLLILFGIIDYIISDKTAKKDKTEIKDKMVYDNRKLKYFNGVTNSFEYAKDIRIFNLKDHIVSIIKNINNNLHQKNKESSRLWLVCWLFQIVISVFREIALYIFLIAKMLLNQLTIGNFTLLLGTARNFSSSFSSFMNDIVKIRETGRQINDFRMLLDLNDNEAISDTSKSDKYSFKFDNVSFCYPQSQIEIIKNFSMEVKSGERIAIVGLNGAGKTTLIKLLCGLYEPSSGKIMLNGNDIKSFSKQSYYNLFSPVFQDINTYAFSIAENVSMQPYELTDVEKAEKCIHLSGLSDKLDSLPNGMNTVMGKGIFEDSIELSGGEKQKLSLARALYKNAPVVILDEPTSALDPIAEYEMYSNFDKLIGNKTAFYISHRLSSTRFCDRIILIEDGRLVECGTHNELMEKKGKYYKLFQKQSEYYTKGDTHNEN